MGYMGLCRAARDAELFLDVARIVILGKEKQYFSLSAREQITVGYFFATVGEPARFPLSVARIVFDFSKEAVQIIQGKRFFRLWRLHGLLSANASNTPEQITMAEHGMPRPRTK